MAETVEWRHDATTEPWLRVALLTGSGLLYGAVTLFAALVAVGFGLVLWTGSWTLRALVVVLLLVGGPFSLLYLVPAFADPDGRPSMGAGAPDPPLSRRERATVGAVGAAVLAAGLWLSPALAAAVAGLGVLAGLTYLAFTTRGRLDPATATLETPTRSLDVGRATGYRVRRVGPVAFVTLRVPNRPGKLVTPTFLRVPTERLDDATAALDGVVTGRDDEDSGRDPNPAVRWVAAGLALLFLAVGAGALVLVDAGIAWYLAVLSWLFAAIFLLVAREG